MSVPERLRVKHLVGEPRHKRVGAQVCGRLNVGGLDSALCTVRASTLREVLIETDARAIDARNVMLLNAHAHETNVSEADQVERLLSWRRGDGARARAA
eukprot:2729526-Prymnesium_polylepis.1